jgi:hypothetical protein
MSPELKQWEREAKEGGEEAAMAGRSFGGGAGGAPAGGGILAVGALGGEGFFAVGTECFQASEAPLRRHQASRMESLSPSVKPLATFTEKSLRRSAVLLVQGVLRRILRWQRVESRRGKSCGGGSRVRIDP